MNTPYIILMGFVIGALFHGLLKGKPFKGWIQSIRDIRL